MISINKQIWSLQLKLHNMTQENDKIFFFFLFVGQYNPNGNYIEIVFRNLTSQCDKYQQTFPLEVLKLTNYNSVVISFLIEICPSSDFKVLKTWLLQLISMKLGSNFTSVDIFFSNFIEIWHEIDCSNRFQSNFKVNFTNLDEPWMPGIDSDFTKGYIK